MKATAIIVEWFEEIKDRVPYADPFFYTDEDTVMSHREMVELDVQWDLFVAVSTELGWM